MSSLDKWMNAYRLADVAEAPKSLEQTDCYVPAEVVFAYARGFPMRWASLVGCRIRLLGRGFGKIVRVDDLTLWVTFDVAVSDRSFVPNEPEAVRSSMFERGPVTGVIFPQGSRHVLVHAAMIMQKMKFVPQAPPTPRVAPIPQSPVRTNSQPSLKARATPLPPLQVRSTPISPISAAAIKDFCHAQGIKHLVHFTREGNLDHILKHGLVSRTQVDEWRRQNGGKFPFVCDEDRLDDHRNAICLSISFPNYRMFYDQQTRHNEEWVVLQLDAAILWELTCAFCFTNAASGAINQIPLRDRMLEASLKMMFADTAHISREVLKIPSHYPTDPQAEVLVVDPIPTKYLQIVYLQFEESRSKWEHGIAQRSELKISLRVTKNFFQARHDYKHWQRIENSTATPTSHSPFTVLR